MKASTPVDKMLSAAETSAVNEFIRSVTIPILRNHDGRVAPFATGTVFEIAERCFLVTAAHVFDNAPEEIGFAAGRVNASTHTFGTFEIARATNRSVDLAVAELLEVDAIERLRTGWRFLKLRNVCLPSTSGMFVLAGYPTALSKTSGKEIVGELIRVSTERILSCPDEVADEIPELDLFFQYRRAAVKNQRDVEPTPHLNGASGASVWEIRRSDRRLWSPEDAAKVVGVQSSFVHSKFFRAQSWQGIVALLQQIDTAIATEVALALDRG